MGFSQIHVQCTSGDMHVRLTRKGKALIVKGGPSRPEQEAILSHDRIKRYPLAADRPDEFLQAIGIMNQSGRVRPSMQDKFRQINEFLRILEQVIPAGRDAARPVFIAD